MYHCCQCKQPVPWRAGLRATAIAPYTCPHCNQQQNNSPLSWLWVVVFVVAYLGYAIYPQHLLTRTQYYTVFWCLTGGGPALAALLAWQRVQRGTLYPTTANAKLLERIGLSVLYTAVMASYLYLNA